MKKTTWRSSLKNEMENEEEMDSYVFFDDRYSIEEKITSID
jgi:hypothetical protein